MIKRIKHLFGVHDVVYYNNGLWGRCSICGKLFGSPLKAFSRVVMENWKKHAANTANNSNHLYKNLKIIGEDRD